MECLDDNAASEFVSGSLPPAALTKVEGHLAGCRDCRALVAALAGDTADDSHAKTVPREMLSPSQVTELPHKRLTVGDRVGRYVVLSSLGAGGMGVVFAAYDPQLDRKIALKLLRANVAASTKDARTRLRREAQAIAQLSHPNVVSVYDVGTTDGGDLYIAMEFVEGDTLTTWLKKYPRTWREIVDVFLQAARGLSAAHAVGLLHRDFKPDNVLVGGDGRVRVTDFGLARSVLTPEEAIRPKPELTALNLALTATGTVLGTPRYMPPEQMTGPDIDARSDQFSFCVALYEALYQVHPLKDGTAVAMLEHGDKAQPPPEGTKIPAAIARVVLRGLERDRSRRFPSMAMLIGELAPRPQRAPVRFVAVALLAAVLLGGTAFVSSHTGGGGRTALMPPDDNGVQPLIDELNKKEAERRQLLNEVKQLRADHEELQKLKVEIAERDTEIHALVDQLTQLQAGKTVPPTKIATKPELAPPPPPAKVTKKQRMSQSFLVVETMSTVQNPIEGCFDEWAERIKGTPEEVSEATLVVKLSVTPEGIASEPVILETPDHHEAQSGQSALEGCVSAQLARVKYPTGPEVLDVEVSVLWSEGLVNVSPRVVAHHEATRRIDLQ